MKKTPIVWPVTDVYPQSEAARAEWEPIVKDYEDNPADLYLSWLYLGHHPLFWNATVVRWSDNNIVPALDFSSAWNRPECLELNLERTRTATTIVLDVQPVLWPSDPDPDDIGFTIYGRTHSETIINAAEAVHDKYGNDRQYITDGGGRWYG